MVLTLVSATMLTRWTPNKTLTVADLDPVRLWTYRSTNPDASHLGQGGEEL